MKEYIELIIDAQRDQLILANLEKEYNYYLLKVQEVKTLGIDI